MLFVVGTLFVLWLPASYVICLGGKTPLLESSHAYLRIERGTVTFACNRTPIRFALRYSELDAFWVSDLRYEAPGAFYVAREQYGPEWISYVVRLPLWLLCAICLAWPVTSFVIARRRRKGRGFEVEARPGAAVPPPHS
jgi:hypothetical protein